MDDFTPPQGEFHHFQMINQNGEVPFSISIMVHFNQPLIEQTYDEDAEPISSNEIIAFHDGLKSFDGDFIKAFSKK